MKFSAIAAIFVGMIINYLVVANLELLSHSIFPVPATLDFNDIHAVHKYMKELPLAALLCILGAWVVGAFVGTYAAADFLEDRSNLGAVCAMMGVFLVGSCAANMMLIPHPHWFIVTALIVVPLTVLLVYTLQSPDDSVAVAPVPTDKRK